MLGILRTLPVPARPGLEQDVQQQSDRQSAALELLDALVVVAPASACRPRQEATSEGTVSSCVESLSFVVGIKPAPKFSAALDGQSLGTPEHVSPCLTENAGQKHREAQAGAALPQPSPT